MENTNKPSGETSGGSAVATPTKAKPAKKRKQQPAQMPKYNVILLNDDDHTYEYVIEMLKVIFGFPDEKGYLMAKEVDQEGRVILMTTHRELAELKRDQVHSYGVDPRVATCKGSMSAKIEPAGD
jgi:ATP-dependent Clp protease adaptor protein ClpS